MIFPKTPKRSKERSNTDNCGGLATQSCPTLCDPMNYSLPGGSSVHGISRQEYWSALPFPSPGNLPGPGIEPWSLALQMDSLLTEQPGKSNTDNIDMQLSHNRNSDSYDNHH